MYKTILYISEVVRHSQKVELPKGLRQIADQSAVANRSHDITGLLAYKSGTYLQVIEGPAAAVDQLIANIQVDVRHSNVQLLIETSAKTRVFPNWKMRLMNGIRTDQQFARFVRLHRQALLALHADQREKFERFAFLEGGAGSRGRYAGLELWMREWPAEGKIDLTPAIVDLIEKLTTARQSYEVLSSEHGFASEEDLRVCLDKLLKLKLVRVEKPAPPKQARLVTLKTQVGAHLRDRMRGVLNLV